MRAYDAASGAEIKQGDEVLDFRGEAARFEYVSRAPSPGKSAKVVVTTVPTIHGGFQREFYAEVYDIEVVA